MRDSKFWVSLVTHLAAILITLAVLAGVGTLLMGRDMLGRQLYAPRTTTHVTAPASAEATK